MACPRWKATSTAAGWWPTATSWRWSCPTGRCTARSTAAAGSSPWPKAFPRPAGWPVRPPDGLGSGDERGETGMTLQVVGAGLGRTGTVSLKGALERLLGGPCYHMVEVFSHLDDHVPRWHAAVRGEPVDWEGLLGGYRAAV